MTNVIYEIPLPFTEESLTVAPPHPFMYPDGWGQNSPCSATYNGWACTRNAGHDFAHAAYGFMEEPFAVWEGDDND